MGAKCNSSRCNSMDLDGRRCKGQISCVVSLLGIDLKYAGRAELCQPAVGVGQVGKIRNTKRII